VEDWTDEVDEARATTRSASVLALTVLLGAAAAGLVWPHLPSTGAAGGNLTLRDLDRRVALLSVAADPIEGERLSSPWAAYARSLDVQLPKDARVFLDGLLGEENGTKVGYYYVLTNYLFPREVAISFGRRAVFHEGWFEGTRPTSRGQLREAGFDLLLEVRPGGVEVIPLSEKATAR
jgi:hypothetical protein